MGSSTTTEYPYGRSHLFFYDGSMHDITPTGYYGKAFNINDNGIVIGDVTSINGSSEKAFYYDGAYHYLDTLGGTYCYAYDINNTGQIVGSSQAADGKYHAFLYDGTMHDLGMSGDTGTLAIGINSTGQVIGYDLGSPFIYENGIMYDLNSLIAQTSEYELYFVYDINDEGQIVGSIRYEDGTLEAVILNPVPEPSIYATLAMGTIGLFAFALRRRK